MANENVIGDLEIGEDGEFKNAPRFLVRKVHGHKGKVVGVLMAGRLGNNVLVSGSRCAPIDRRRFDLAKGKAIAMGRLKKLARYRQNGWLAPEFAPDRPIRLAASLANGIEAFYEQCEEHYKGCTVVLPEFETFKNGVVGGGEKKV